MEKDGCINRRPPSRTPVEERADDTLIRNNERQANMDSEFNWKEGHRWLRQAAYNASVRRELRRRGLPVAPVTGKKRPF